MPHRFATQDTEHFEISQPTEIIKADYARARRDIAFITLALFVAIIVIVLLVMRHNLLLPIRELLGGAKAVGQGDLDIIGAQADAITDIVRQLLTLARRSDPMRNQASACSFSSKPA